MTDMGVRCLFFAGILLVCLVHVTQGYPNGDALFLGARDQASTPTAFSILPRETASPAGSDEDPPDKDNEAGGLESSDLISIGLGLASLVFTALFSGAPAWESILNLRILKQMREEERKANALKAQQAAIASHPGAQGATTP